MHSAPEHYEQLLASIYSWSLGDEHAISAAASKELDELGVLPSAQGSLAVDLGCGHGVYLRHLASRGFQALGLDSSPTLLRQANALEQPGIQTRHADLRSPKDLDFGDAEWVLCLGDTLTHLESIEQVAALVGAVSDRLRPGGTFVSTFRDYTARPLQGERRFIPVRLTDTRLFTCFVEDAGNRIRVHDVVHERAPEGWTMRVSAYEKIKIAPDELVSICASAGLCADMSVGPRGMVRCVARVSSGARGIRR